MNKQDIKDIVSGLIEIAGSNRLIDILDYLDIKIINVPNMSKYASFVHKNKTSMILLSTDTPDEIKDFVIAHEIGHSILHDYEMIHYSKAINRKSSRLEREADYFAFCLLDKEIDLVENYTVEDYSKILGVNEEVVKYILNNTHI